MSNAKSVSYICKNNIMIIFYSATIWAFYLIIFVCLLNQQTKTEFKKKMNDETTTKIKGITTFCRAWTIVSEGVVYATMFADQIWFWSFLGKMNKETRMSLSKRESPRPGGLAIAWSVTQYSFNRAGDFLKRAKATYFCMLMVICLYYSKASLLDSVSEWWPLLVGRKQELFFFFKDLLLLVEKKGKKPYNFIK